MRSIPLRPSAFRSRSVALTAALGLVLAACGADALPEPEPEADTAADVEASDDEGERTHIVATTSILGDIVGQLAGDDAEVSVIMPPGADPHAFEPSAQDGATLREADLVVANGLMLEENLVSVLEAVEEEGGNVFELADLLDPIDFDWDGPDDHGHDDNGDEHGHDDEGDDHGHDHDDDGHGHDDNGDDHGHGHDDNGDDHGHDDEGDEHGHGHDDNGDEHGHDDEGDDHGHEHDDDGHGHDENDHGHEHDDDDHGHDDGDDHGHDDHDDHGHSHDEDPHIWFDPIRVADGIELIAAEIASVDTALDDDEWMTRADAYVEELMEVHEEMEATFATIPDENRQLVTNHDALGYLAVRYDFEVLGTVIPGSSTQADADPRGFSELIATVEEADVRAVFAENTDSTVLAEQLQSEVIDRGDLEIEVVRIYTDALGEEGSGAETYLGLLRTTSELIADALG